MLLHLLFAYKNLSSVLVLGDGGLVDHTVAGEGAGMAGGITSAAVDGVRLAEAMLRFH